MTPRQRGRGRPPEPPDRGDETPLRAREGVWLLACLVLAAILRGLRLGAASLWTDELITLVTVERPFGDGLLQLQDYSAPAYQLLLRALVRGGEHPPEWLLRAPAFLFGVLAVAAAWWFARTLFGGPAAALTALLLAFNPQQVHFAREARPYTLFVLASALSATFFFRLARRGGKGDLTGYAAATLLLVWSHYLGFLLFAAQLAWVGLGAVLTRRLPSRALAAGCGVAAAGSLPAAWLASRFLTSGARGLVGWVPERGFWDAFLLLGEGVGARQLGLLCAIPLLSALWITSTPFDGGGDGGSGVAGGGEGRSGAAPAGRGAGWWERRQAPVLCALWVGFGLFALGLVSALYHPMLLPRYALPVAVPMLALGAAYLLRTSRGALVLVLAAALYGSLLAGSTNLRDELAPARSSRGLRELAGWLADEADPRADLLVVDWSFCEGFVNPEVRGLLYYGVPAGRLAALPVRYPERIEVLDPRPLRPDRRTYILGLNLVRPAVAGFLDGSGRRWAAGPVGVNLLLFQVEPAGR